MTRLGAFARALCLAAAAVLPGTAAAQSFVAQPQQYMMTTEAADGRSLWLQPAGLSRRRESSLAGLLTADESGGLSQYGITLASGGLGIGWQRDRKIGSGTDVFSVGLGFGGPLAGIGADHRWYRGSGAKDGSWDIGARLNPAPALDLSIVWRDIGTPVFYVDSTSLAHTLRPTLVPGAALNVLGRLRLAAEWEVVTDVWSTSAIRLGLATQVVRGLSLSVRGDFAGNFDGRALAIALTWSGPEARATGFGSLVKGGTDRFGGWLAAVRDLSRSRRGGPFR